MFSLMWSPWCDVDTHCQSSLLVSSVSHTPREESPAERSWGDRFTPCNDASDTEARGLNGVLYPVTDSLLLTTVAGF